MSGFTVEREDGERFYRVVGPDGEWASGRFGSKMVAETYCDALEKKSRQRERPCLTCTKPFMSDGPGNRMCSLCRAQGSTASWLDGAGVVE